MSFNRVQFISTDCNTIISFSYPYDLCACIGKITMLKGVFNKLCETGFLYLVTAKLSVEPSHEHFLSNAS